MFLLTPSLTKIVYFSILQQERVMFGRTHSDDEDDCEEVCDAVMDCAPLPLLTAPATSQMSTFMARPPPLPMQQKRAFISKVNKNYAFFNFCRLYFFYSKVLNSSRFHAIFFKELSAAPANSQLSTFMARPPPPPMHQKRAFVSKVNKNYITFLFL